MPSEDEFELFTHVGPGTPMGREHLGASDGGVILIRQMMREALAAVAEGKDPLGVIRDEAQQVIVFPQKSEIMHQRQEGVGYDANWRQPVGAAQARGSDDAAAECGR